MSDSVIIHSREEILEIKKAGQAAGFVRETLKNLIQPGMSTKEIDEIAKALIESTGGESAFFGYRGFPGQICISLNDEVVHGIGRSSVIVKDGDIVSIDVGILLDGYVGDTAESIIAGEKRRSCLPAKKNQRGALCRDKCGIERKLCEGYKLCCSKSSRSKPFRHSP